LLGSAHFGNTVVIADLEAGIGTLTRLDPQTVDVVVVVVEPTPRSIEVARRAIDLADERGKGHVVIVGNRIVDLADESRLRDAFPGHDLILVPLDQAVADADRNGLSPLDHAPGSLAVLALLELADHLNLGR
jgi:CO dehydrogenase maturation factor